MKTLEVIDLGSMPYQQAWDLQKAVQKRLIDEKIARRTDHSAEIELTPKDDPSAKAVPSAKIELTAKDDPSAKAVPSAEIELTAKDDPSAKAVPSAEIELTAKDDPSAKMDPSAETDLTAKTDASAKQSNDVLLFVEHPHVYTLGKSGDGSHLLAAAGDLDRIGATYVKIDRGGDITYHGPGQVVGYPIIDLDRHYTDIHRYLRELEEVMIRVCADYGFTAVRIDGLTGVWIGDAKICAFGVKCSRWVTMHGFAFNVNTSLDYFGHIVPCGITDKKVTSLQQLLGRTVDAAEVKKRITGHFGTVFGVNTVGIDHLPEWG